MRFNEITQAEREAKRFLEKIKIVKKKCSEIDLMTGTKDTGSLRRQSLELTRSLSKMRDPKLWD